MKTFDSLQAANNDTMGLNTNMKRKRRTLLEMILSHPMVESVDEDFGNLEYGKKDYWVYLKREFINGLDDTSSIHTRTLRDAWSDLKFARKRRDDEMDK